MNEINFSQPCYPAGTNNLYRAAWHCYNMDSFTLQKPQALINNCMLLLPHHSLWQYNILPTKTSKAKIYMEDLKFIKCRIWFLSISLKLKAYPPVLTWSVPCNSSVCFCLCSWILHSWYTRKRDVTCDHTESQPLPVLSGQTQQQPPLTPATLMQCQCCNALVKGALENLAEIFFNLLQWLGGFSDQRKGEGEGEKPIKFTSRLRKNTPLPIYF